MKMKLSVVIPIYNVEPYLQKCLDSVILQTYNDLEIILVDDGSPDRCGKICDEYARRDARIRVIHKENGGLSAARNDGMDAAHGDWVIFIDSDDWIEEDYFERLTDALDEGETDVVCAGGCYLETEKESKLEQTIRTPFVFETRQEINRLVFRDLSNGYEIKEFIHNKGFAAPWDKMYRLSFLRENRLRFDCECKMAEDTLFNVDVFARARRVIGSTYAGVHYRMVTGSITKGYSPNKPIYCIAWQKKLEERRRSLFERDSDMLQVVDVSAVGLVLSALRCCYLHAANPDDHRSVAAKVAKMKNDTLLHRAIWSRDNRYYTRNMLVLKYALRLPWLWPLRLMWSVRTMIKNKP